MSINKIINFIGFQVIWLTCVFGAAKGYPLAGPLAMMAWLAIHFYINKKSIQIDLPLVVITASIGYLLDSILVLLGTISFPEQAQLGYPSTLWMIALWVNLAITIRHSLDWLNNRYVLILIFGGTGGVLAYWAGVKIGALLIPDLTLGLIVVFSVWSFAMPLLYFISNKLTARQYSTSLKESHSNV